MVYEARLFPSKICKTVTSMVNVQRPCPSLFYFPGITAKPWHDSKDFPFTKHLTKHFQEIKDEYLEKKEEIERIASKAIDVDPFHKVKEGSCLKYPYILNGHINSSFHLQMPNTFRILQELSKRGDGPMLNIPFSSSYISIMKPITTIDKHYGPCNIRLRAHLPLLLPDSEEACFIRVGGQIKFWKEGEIIVFDDTYEHESCNLSDIHERVLLVFDVWHPELMPQERQAIIEMFQNSAQGQ
ncbi:aspartyl asparaginyl beta- [Stylonychia lemnae]|uniref:Aspartyl asparaginyl beta n=1 Tax=Stylonychia lemnae TaxID=5949 RepID=A0A078B3R1_STYLE|nr:aspartyl asparaginyl beta- [Stylonychia lemnae]|eukprot:CDW89104.1 aspartyl asparaginyl beta- [Stylonychia lemnae]